MCVHNVVEYLKRRGVRCDVCSPYGPDIKIPLDFISKKKYGVLSLLRYWHRVSKYFEDSASDYDVVWLHQPFLLTKCPFESCLVTMHTSIFDFNKIVQKSNYPARLKIYYGLREKIEKRCIQAINNYSSYFSVVSPHVGSALEGVGVPRTKIVYIPNGVDIHKFKPNAYKNRLRKFYGIPENDLIFTYVGRITWQKQPFTLIRFFSKLSQRLKNASLIITGNGELLNDAMNLASNLGLKKKVLFLGYVNDERLPSVYACSDVYLMASIYEGQPLTVFEAMASGLPPIVSNIPSLRHIVEESNTGLVLDFDNIEEAIKKTLRFIKEENLQEHSRRARLFIEDKHSWEKVANQYVQLFNKIPKS